MFEQRLESIFAPWLFTRSVPPKQPVQGMLPADALGSAALAGGRAHANDALGEKAELGIDEHLVGTLEFGEGHVRGLGVAARALFAQRYVGG